MKTKTTLAALLLAAGLNLSCSVVHAGETIYLQNAHGGESTEYLTQIKREMVATLTQELTQRGYDVTTRSPKGDNRSISFMIVTFDTNYEPAAVTYAATYTDGTVGLHSWLAVNRGTSVRYICQQMANSIDEAYR